MNDEARRLAVPLEGRLSRVLPERLEYVYEQVDVTEDEAGHGIDLRGVWIALNRNKYLIAGMVAVCMMVGLAAALLTAPRYEATASIQIDQQTAKILEAQDVEPVVSSVEAERFLQTQVDVIQSRSLAERVAKNLGLDEKFIQASGGKLPEPGETAPVGKLVQEQVIETLQANLSVELPRNSRVVKLTFESRDPELAARIANSYAENFITGNLQRRYDTSAYSREFLQGQLAETKRRLEASERQLIAYARSAGLIDASTGVVGDSASAGPRSLTTSSLVQLNQAYSVARSQRVQAQQRWSQAQATPAMSLPEVLSNPTVQQLTQRRAELEAQYEEERQRRQEAHPAVMQAAARIAELDRQINTLASSIRNSIREQYQIAAKQEQALAGNVGQLKGETLAEQDRSVRYTILKRDVDTSRQLYEGLLQRFREISAAAGITTNNVSVVDRAVAPVSPSWPKPILNMALGGAGGFALALLLVFLREKLDDAIRVPEDVERKLNLSLLGMAPLIEKGLSPVEALADPRSNVSEAYAAVRTSLELSSGDGLPKTLLLTSTRPGEGKSTSSYAVAREFALSGKHVLLIDGDLRKPSLHKVVGTQRREGLSNLLARQNSFDELIQTTSTEGLLFLASGPTPPNAAQLLSGTAFNELLAKLSQLFDLVVIDGPPVLGLSDAPRLANAAGGTIFVVEAGGANRGQTKAALKRLWSSRANIVGVVLTKFNNRTSGYGDYDYYSYGVEAPRHETVEAIEAR